MPLLTLFEPGLLDGCFKTSRRLGQFGWLRILCRLLCEASEAKTNHAGTTQSEKNVFTDHGMAFLQKHLVVTPIRCSEGINKAAAMSTRC
jgi:hypothetical protein